LSDIRANTISDAAGTGPITLTGQSAAKAWASFNGTASPLSLEDSFNTSSLTDNGAGNHHVNFTNNMNNAYYYANADANATRIANAEGREASRVQIRIANSSGTGVDRAGTRAITVGDLA